MEYTEKLYYSISEVASMMKVNASLIRFWEKEFNSYIKPKKNRNGKRMFTQQDIDVLNQIYHLTKEKGYTLSGARTILNSKRNTVEKEAFIAGTLQKVKSFLTELKEDIN
jgi:DNA-binding transcriptional MerR regulator